MTLPHLPVVLVGTVWGLPILLPQYPRRTGTTDLHGSTAHMRRQQSERNWASRGTSAGLARVAARCQAWGARNLPMAWWQVCERGAERTSWPE